MSRNIEPLFLEEENGCNSIEGTSWGEVITINVDNPLAGSTDTGFGYNCSVSLDANAALKLAEWLLTAAEQISAKPVRHSEDST